MAMLRMWHLFRFNEGDRKVIIVGFDIDKSSMSGSMAKMSQLLWVLNVMEGWVYER